MKQTFQFLLAALIMLAGIKLLTGAFKSPPKEPVAALEIQDIELPIQPRKPKEKEILPKEAKISSPPALKSKPPTENLSPLAAPVPAKPAPAVSATPPPQLLPQPPPLTDQEIYERFSGAVIQVLCASREELFSASGVIVNERGLILTNAHVAEIVKKSGEKNCQARHGNPADPFAKIEIVYIASTTPKIGKTKIAQRDFAFLKIIDAKESFSVAGIDFTPMERNSTVLTLGYPSEFLEGINTSVNSNLVFSALAVAGYADVDGDLGTAEGYVFKGGLILQQGSSGTALFNRSGNMVGLIFATTKGETTADRDGLALMTHYLDNILKIETGEGLMDFIVNH